MVTIFLYQVNGLKFEHASVPGLMYFKQHYVRTSDMYITLKRSKAPYVVSRTQFSVVVVVFLF